LTPVPPTPPAPAVPAVPAQPPLAPAAPPSPPPAPADAPAVPPAPPPAPPAPPPEEGAPPVAGAPPEAVAPPPPPDDARPPAPPPPSDRWYTGELPQEAPTPTIPRAASNQGRERAQNEEEKGAPGLSIGTARGGLRKRGGASEPGRQRTSRPQEKIPHRHRCVPKNPDVLRFVAARGNLYTAARRDPPASFCSAPAGLCSRGRDQGRADAR